MLRFEFLKIQSYFWVSQFKMVTTFQNLKENSFQIHCFWGMNIWSINMASEEHPYQENACVTPPPLGHLTVQVQV